MAGISVLSPDLLAAARGGDGDALAELLEAYRPYLLELARARVSPDLAPKAAPSDVVQQTVVDGWAGFAKFAGRTEADFVAWLRVILVNNVTDLAKQFKQANKRRVDREVPAADCGWDDRLPDRGNTPSWHAVRSEEQAAMFDALERLPEDHRLVVRLRHEQGLPFAEVAAQLGRSEDATRQLWCRAIRLWQNEVERAYGRP